MKRLVIKIEKDCVQFAEVARKNGGLLVNKARMFPIPGSLSGEAMRRDPVALADFIFGCLKRGRLAPIKADLLFHAPLCLSREYCHERSGGRERYRRASAEAEAAFPAEDGVFIAENQWYGSHENQNGMQVSAVFGIPEDFLRTLTGELKRRGLKVGFAGSALASCADIAKRLLERISARSVLSGKNIAVIDVAGSSVSLFLFAALHLIHQEETSFSGGSDGEAELLAFIARRIRKAIRYSANPDDRESIRLDYVIFSGGASGAKGFAERAAGLLNIPCRIFGDFYAELHDELDLGGELVGRKTLFSSVVALASVQPGLKKRNNFLDGGVRGKNEKRKTALFCAIFALATFLAVSAPPAYDYYMALKCGESREIVERPEYVGARRLIAEREYLKARLEIHMADEEYLKEPQTDYAALLYQISRAVFYNSTVEKLNRVGERAMAVTFTTDDIEGFMKARDNMNAAGKVAIEEAVTMQATEEEGYWRCVTVVRWPEPGDASQGERNER
ncbi:MAG: hypothetical protein LBT34_02440 [Clostridiales Family XIII bacterium]|jgi:hypothetical protein|nr:hypothetical protein [Clostridiales Family XIII bacterium]